MSYSLWDDVKLLLFCIAAGLAAGGIYLTLGIYHDPEHFAIEVPRALDVKSFVMGLIAQAMVCLARIPELRSGESRSKAGFKPVHAVDDPLFWFLIAENFFNLLSIVLLSSNAQYLLVQSPWIGGGALMILLDCVLISRIRVWQRRWKERKGSDGETGAEKEAERAARLAKLDEEKAQLEEEWEVEDMHVEAHAPVPKQRDGESMADYKRRVHAHAVARKDYLENQHLVADIKERGERRGDSSSSYSEMSHVDELYSISRSTRQEERHELVCRWALPSAPTLCHIRPSRRRPNALRPSSTPVDRRRTARKCSRLPSSTSQMAAFDRRRGALGLDGAHVDRRESRVQRRHRSTACICVSLARKTKLVRRRESTERAAERSFFCMH
ncbi:hypothetical protein BJY59DRAFT_694431 [Rhodotorula toruloides]